MDARARVHVRALNENHPPPLSAATLEAADYIVEDVVSPLDRQLRDYKKEMRIERKGRETNDDELKGKRCAVQYDLDTFPKADSTLLW
jgi:hypothetical protein